MNEKMGGVTVTWDPSEYTS